MLLEINNKSVWVHVSHTIPTTSKFLLVFMTFQPIVARVESCVKSQIFHTFYGDNCLIGDFIHFGEFEMRTRNGGKSPLGGHKTIFILKHKNILLFTL